MFLRFAAAATAAIVVSILVQVLRHNSYNHVGTELTTDYLWGTYRPGVYYGARTANLGEDPSQGVIIGLAWSGADQRGAHQFRHTCNSDDRLATYGWIYADPKHFAEQVIRDPDLGVELNCSFSKPGDDATSWVADVRVDPLPGYSAANISLFVYVTVDEFHEGTSYVSPRLASGPERLSLTTAAPLLAGFAADRSNEDNVVVVEGAAADVGGRFVMVTGVEGGSATFAAGNADLRHDAWKAEAVIEALLPSGGRRSSSSVRRHGHPRTPPGERKSGGVPPHLRRLPNSAVQLPDGLGLRMKDSAADSGGGAPGKEQHGFAVVQAFLNSGEGRITAVFAPVQRHGHPEAGIADAMHDVLGTPSSPSASALTLDDFTRALRENYQSRFEKTFQLAGKFPPEDISFAQAAASNLLGAIGFFEGTWFVRDGAGEPEVEVGPDKLLSAVPCRPTFPRGFLWDEGFHGLLVGAWDPALEREILRSWLNMMEPTGWIAREQTLGPEARSRIPPEFVTQDRTVANPPSMLLSYALLIRNDLASAAHPSLGLASSGVRPLGAIPENGVLGNDTKTFLHDAYPRLKKHFEWYLHSQAGPLPYSFRWRGRSEDGRHTLASGLDDYPRGVLPTPDEMHVDLHAWMAFASGLVSNIAGVIGREDDRAKYAELKSVLVAAMEEYHWNPQENAYCDFGATSADEVRNERGRVVGVRAGQRGPVCHDGYVALFPMLMRLIPASSAQLGHVLDMIENPQRLWSGFGIRSLGVQDSYFGKDENYWRGPIWVNINYLVLSSLKAYSEADGPYAQRCASLYTQLRSDVVENIHDEYRRTGYLWEQYHAMSGEGQRGHPFAGWTALVVLIMAEVYP